MTTLDPLLLTVTGGLILAGLIMVGAGVRAYHQTGQRVMIYLAIGFGLVVTATLVSAGSVLLMEVQNVRTLLLVNNSFSLFGYSFVVYSVYSYK